MPVGPLQLTRHPVATFLSPNLSFPVCSCHSLFFFSFLFALFSNSRRLLSSPTCIYLESLFHSQPLLSYSSFSLIPSLPFLSFGISDSFTISVPSLHFSRCLCLPLLSHSYLAVPGCPWNPGPIRPPRRGAGRARPARRAAAACYGATECNRLSAVASRGSRPPGPRKCSASQNSWAAPGFWLQRTRPPLLETPPYPEEGAARDPIPKTTSPSGPLVQLPTLPLPLGTRHRSGEGGSRLYF